ncbi:transporter substrate-binding domain-containing protein [Sinorhizobium meliloti]|uniref:transporter substrate-binding domain-containing protein n=1 Tax=Rhizobium meliloti TaxID=382 RepID=UPI000D1FBCCE|nr:transporter substrate-binding domain-containing protein [Sinorhizobium meliloti]RMI14829.1 ectoine/hydroxyectoine ABC transporter substrate-binding protein EhuB [Sinorhizobium meliloti]
MQKRITKLIAVAAMSLSVLTELALAGPLLEATKNGKPIRLGYMIAQPTSFTSQSGEPDGMINVFAINVLKKMGHSDVEGAVMDWGGLIPALQANRIDIISAGMYITKERCSSVQFSDPMLVLPDVLIVPKGNPKKLYNYQDVAMTGAVLAEPAGYAPIETAKRYGVSVENIMILPGNTQVLAALRSGRADAYATSLIEAEGLLKSSNETSMEITDPSKMPEDTKNWLALAFRKNDSDFVKAFNEAQKAYIADPKMMPDLAPYGHSKDMVPGTKTASALCQ